MKTMKKTTAAIALAATAGLVAGPMVGMSQAWAEATPGKITITQNEANKGTVSYSAYQIFTANIDEKGMASNIEWANDDAKAIVCEELGITASDRDSAQQAADALTKLEGTGANKHIASDHKLMSIAKALQAVKDLAVSTAADGVLNAEKPGYYMIVSNVADGQKDTVATAPIFIAVGASGVEVTEKVSVPTVEKTVTDDAAGAVPGEVADANIGQKLTFTLEGTLPSNLESFDTYYYAFHDSFDEGVFDVISKDDVVVKIGTTEIEDGFTVTPSATGLDVVFENIKAVDAATAGATVTVEYKAALGAKATTGVANGNPNQVYIEYSKNPTTSEKGQSTPDDAKVYSYALKINKVDSLDQDKVLSGAKFEIWEGDTKITEGTTNEQGVLELKGLDAGTYTVKEVKPPAGYQPVADFNITITAADLGKETASVTQTGGSVDAVLAQTPTAGFEAEVTVSDRADLNLPITGEQGILLICVAGMVLVGASAFSIVRSRRNADMED